MWIYLKISTHLLQTTRAKSDVLSAWTRACGDPLALNNTHSLAKTEFPAIDLLSRECLKVVLRLC